MVKTKGQSKKRIKTDLFLFFPAISLFLRAVQVLYYVREKTERTLERYVFLRRTSLTFPYFYFLLFTFPPSPSTHFSFSFFAFIPLAKLLPRSRQTRIVVEKLNTDSKLAFLIRSIGVNVAQNFYNSTFGLRRSTFVTAIRASNISTTLFSFTPSQ